VFNQQTWPDRLSISRNYHLPGLDVRISCWSVGSVHDIMLVRDRKDP